jgi:hypothetical protein
MLNVMNETSSQNKHGETNRQNMTRSTATTIACTANDNTTQDHRLVGGATTGVNENKTILSILKQVAIVPPSVVTDRGVGKEADDNNDVTDFDKQDLEETPSESNNIIINKMDNKTLVDWVPHVDHQDQNDDNAEEDEQPRVMSLPTALGASLQGNKRKNKTFDLATSVSISDASPIY